MTPVYLDSSALMKLVKEEAETDALRRTLSGSVVAASSELSFIEVVRGARRQGADLEARAREVLEKVALRPIDRPVVERAAALEPAPLRTLDALHLATALALGLDVFVSYDHRLNEAAETVGLDVRSPA